MQAEAHDDFRHPMGHQTYRASLSFPATMGESWTVRSGAGRAVERWTVDFVQTFKTYQLVQVRIAAVEG